MCTKNTPFGVMRVDRVRVMNGTYRHTYTHGLAPTHRVCAVVLAVDTAAVAVGTVNLGQHALPGLVPVALHTIKYKGTMAVQ